MGRVDEIRARVEALEELNDEPGPSTATDDRWAGLDDIREADAVEEEIAAHAPADLRWLLDEVERLRDGVEALAVACETFAPGGEIGPQFSAGQSHAYADAAKRLRALLEVPRG